MNILTHSKIVVLLSNVALCAGREMSKQGQKHPARESAPMLSLLKKPEEQTWIYKAALEFFLRCIFYFVKAIIKFLDLKESWSILVGYYEKH